MYCNARVKTTAWRPLRWPAIGLCALSASMSVSAQQHYTVRELRLPVGLAGTCELAWQGDAPLDEDGNVYGWCPMWTGGIYFVYGLPIPDGRGKTVTWKADGTRVLSSYPASASAWRAYGRDASGRLYADLVATPVRSFNALKQLGTYTYNGSTWAKWTPPSPLTGNWQIAQLSRSGMMLLAAQDAAQAGALAVVKGTAVTRLPLAPTQLQGDVLGARRMTPNGHVLVQTHAAGTPATPAAPRWFWWNGVQWQERNIGGLAKRGMGGTGDPGVAVLDINANDEALITTDQTPDIVADTVPYTYSRWQIAADTVQTLPTWLGYGPSGSLNDAGDVVGENLPAGTPLSASFGPRRATIWKGGQAIDFNTVTTLPSGLVLRQAIAVNNKGQILVSTDGSTSGWSWAVLTPQ
ncbi:MAG: hypothetical protein QM749_16685 [Aquabacterium sp.]